MISTQFPGAQSNRQHRLPNGVNTTGPHKRGYAYHALSAGANASAGDPRTSQHSVPASSDSQQLGAWKNWNQYANPASLATTEHNPLPERVKLRCPIHAGPDGHLKCWYRGNGFPDMLKVREHVASKHPSLCPACNKLLVGPSTWNAHKKARAAGRQCPVADSTPDNAMGPLWQSVEVLDDFHYRRAIKDVNGGEGIRAAWEKLYRQLHNVPSDEGVPSPFQSYTIASSSVSTAGSPLSSAPSPPAFTPGPPVASGPFASIDEAVHRLPEDTDMTDVECSGQEWTNFVAGADAQTFGDTPQQSLGVMPLFGSAPTPGPAALGVFENVDATLGASQSTSNGGDQDAFGHFAMVSESSTPSTQILSPPSFQPDSSLVAGSITPESHILQAQTALRYLKQIPAAAAALQSLQSALSQLRTASVEKEYWKSKASQASDAEHFLKISIAAELTDAADQYSLQGSEAETLEELYDIGAHLRDKVHKVINELKIG